MDVDRIDIGARLGVEVLLNEKAIKVDLGWSHNVIFDATVVVAKADTLTLIDVFVHTRASLLFNIRARLINIRGSTF